MNIDPVILAMRSAAEGPQKILDELEAELVAVKARRDKISADIWKAEAAAEKGDKRQLFVLGSLNKEGEAQGRLVLSIERQIAEAKKRLGLAANQVAAMRAASVDDASKVRDKLFAIAAPDGRRVRHRGASREDVRRRLQIGYTLVGQVHGADADGIGGFVPRPGFLTAMLEAYEGELIEWLEAHGLPVARDEKAA